MQVLGQKTMGVGRNDQKGNAGHVKVWGRGFPITVPWPKSKDMSLT